MPKRKIIHIDREKCNGCGNCITGCAEGALALVDGKAQLVKELFCDGFGDCVGTCPTGALTIEERESDAFDPQATIEHVRQTGGDEAVERMLAANQVHEAKVSVAKPTGGGCPGLRQHFDSSAARPAASAAAPVAGDGQVYRSELNQWPIQLHLVQPSAPFFQGRELAIMSTCSPIASPDVNWRFVRGRGVVVACPKLDRTEGYVEKLAAIFREGQVPKASILRMEVPCCGGLTQIALRARELSGRGDLKLEEVTVKLNGDIVAIREL